MFQTRKLFKKAIATMCSVAMLATLGLPSFTAMAGNATSDSLEVVSGGQAQGQKSVTFTVKLPEGMTIADTDQLTVLAYQTGSADAATIMHIDQLAGNSTTEAKIYIDKREARHKLVFDNLLLRDTVALGGGSSTLNLKIGGKVASAQNGVIAEPYLVTINMEADAPTLTSIGGAIHKDATVTTAPVSFTALPEAIAAAAVEVKEGVAFRIEPSFAPAGTSGKLDLTFVDALGAPITTGTAFTGDPGSSTAVRDITYHYVAATPALPLEMYAKLSVTGNTTIAPVFVKIKTVPNVASITVTDSATAGGNTSATVKAGSAAFTVYAHVLPVGSVGTIDWTSTDESAATVVLAGDGKSATVTPASTVTGDRTTNITATISGVTAATFAVTVKNETPATTIAIKNGDVELGGSATLVVHKGAPITLTGALTAALGATTTDTVQWSIPNNDKFTIVGGGAGAGGTGATVTGTTVTITAAAGATDFETLVVLTANAFDGSAVRAGVTTTTNIKVGKAFPTDVTFTPASPQSIVLLGNLPVVGALVGTDPEACTYAWTITSSTPANAVSIQTGTEASLSPTINGLLPGTATLTLNVTHADKGTTPFITKTYNVTVASGEETITGVLNTQKDLTSATDDTKARSIAKIFGKETVAGSNIYTLVGSGSATDPYVAEYLNYMELPKTATAGGAAVTWAVDHIAVSLDGTAANEVKKSVVGEAAWNVNYEPYVNAKVYNTFGNTKKVLYNPSFALLGSKPASTVGNTAYVIVALKGTPTGGTESIIHVKLRVVCYGDVDNTFTVGNKDYNEMKGKIITATSELTNTNLLLADVDFSGTFGNPDYNKFKGVLITATETFTQDAK